MLHSTHAIIIVTRPILTSRFLFIYQVVKIGISLAVSVIPEGLVAVVTITMALGVQRMSQKKVIVRNLPVVEGLGSVTSVCFV